MSSPGEDLIMREIEDYAESPATSSKSTDSEPLPLSTVTATSFLEQKDPSAQPEIWGMETRKTRVVDKVRLANQLIDAMPLTSRPLGLLQNNPASKLDEFDLKRIKFQNGIPEFVELRLPSLFERPDWDIPGWTCLYELSFRLGLRFTVPFCVDFSCDSTTWRRANYCLTSKGSYWLSRCSMSREGSSLC
ncbi:hypothetical protein ACOSP7_031163 [Xanthoceras sorbifolium]